MKNLKKHIAALRYDFKKGGLDEHTAKKNPLAQFEQWFRQAVKKNIREPNAMVLSTATSNGTPSSRIVLLRDYDTNGFIFYTNYTSRKGKEIDANPKGALLFYWADLEKQIRVEGSISKISDSKSSAYFSSRPRESQLGAWISQQSAVIASRQALEEKFASLAAKSANQKIKRPHFWGGYVLKPVLFEFWQGRASRLHDRLRYSKTKSGWKIERLSP